MICTILGVLSVAVTGYGGSPGKFITGTAANMFANMATDWLRSICRFGDEAYLRRYRGIDENHVIVRKLREAQLRALGDLLRRFNSDRGAHRDPAQENFAELLAEFIKREQGLACRFRFAGAATASEAEKTLRVAVVSKLPQAAGLALSARHGPAGATEDRDQFRRACEAAVLGELRALVFQDIPPLFLSAFAGSPHRADGWFDLFFRAVAAELRKDAEFDRLWQAEQSAAILYLARETAERAIEIEQAVQALRDGVVAQGEALDALAGQVAAVRFYAAAMHHRTIGEGVMPLDFAAEVDIAGYHRFMPRNPRVPFLGREEELDALLRFVHAPPDYAWWLVCGAGGAGKTRLALRFAMLAHREEWRVGFLPKEYKAAIPDLDAWQPQLPTLIVADYTLKRRDAVRVLAERLARRAGSLPQPVRLLLIEREGGESFDTQFLGADSQGVIKPHRYADPSIGGELPALPRTEDDLWTLVREGRWNEKARPMPGSVARQEFFRRLDALDAQRRPLVAMILADAITSEPDRPVFDSLGRELGALLDRDRRELWPDEARMHGDRYRRSGLRSGHCLRDDDRRAGRGGVRDAGGGMRARAQLRCAILCCCVGCGL